MRKIYLHEMPLIPGKPPPPRLLRSKVTEQILTLSGRRREMTAVVFR